MSRCDVTDSGSRPIIASSATHSPVSASAINDGPLIVPPGRSCRVVERHAHRGRASARTVFDLEVLHRAREHLVEELRDLRRASSRSLARPLGAQAVDAGPPLPSAACAAARRAIGTRNGEHDT